MRNNQEEDLIHQSKWNGRRVVLFYWFIIVFLGTAAAAGLTGTSVFKPIFKIEADPHEDITEPWHPDDCVACHPDEVAGWETTWHAQLVGEYDPSDPLLNGSRMSYNSTHFWRTPKTNITPPNYWTYNQIFNASGQQCCMTTRWINTTLINATTGEVLWVNATLVDQYGGNIWDIGISCAACHVNPGEISLSYSVCSFCHIPGGRQFTYYIQSAHYNSLDDLLASSDPQSLLYGNWSYIGQSTYMTMGSLEESEYYRITCVTCHDPHNATINTGEESDTMSPWTNPYTGEKFGPGGSQLRAATINELCGICHDTKLNTTTNSYLDPSNHIVLDCTDCHGYSFTPVTYFENGTVNEPSSFSNLQHDWKFIGGEPGEVCGLCHGTDNATVYAQMLTYQALYGNVTGLKSSYETKLAAALIVWETASTTSGANYDKILNSYALIEEAIELELQVSTSKLVFHNPETGLAFHEEKLSLALTKLDAAIAEAIDALPEPEESTTTSTSIASTTTKNDISTTTISTSEDVTTEDSTGTTIESTTEQLSSFNITPGFSAYLILAVLMMLLPLKKRRKD